MVISIVPQGFAIDWGMDICYHSKAMKAILKRIIFYSTSLFVTSRLVSGLHLSTSIQNVVFTGFILTVMMFVLKPILQLLAFPLNVITFGLFSFAVNAIILYLLTLFLPFISVSSFSIPAYTFAGFATPALMINNFFAFLVISFLVSGIYSAITWLTTE